MIFDNVEPGEVYLFAQWGGVDVLSPYAPPVELIGKPCAVKGKSPNRSLSVRFAGRPETFQVFAHTLDPVPGRKYRPWPPPLEDLPGVV